MTTLPLEQAMKSGQTTFLRPGIKLRVNRKGFSLAEDSPEVRVFIGGYEITEIVKLKHFEGRVDVPSRDKIKFSFEVEASFELREAEPDDPKKRAILVLGEVPEAEFLSKMVALRLGVIPK